MGKDNPQPDILFIEKDVTVSPQNLRGYQSVYTMEPGVKDAEVLESDFVCFADVALAQRVAYDHLDDLFCQYTEGHCFDVLKPYLGEDAVLAAKSCFFDVFAELYLSFYLAAKFKKEYGIDETIDFLPKCFPYSLYKEIKDKANILPKGVQIPEWYLNKMKWAEICNKIKYCIGVRGYIYSLMLKMKKFGATERVNHKYDYGIHVWASLFRDMKNGSILPEILQRTAIFTKANSLLVMPKKISGEDEKILEKEDFDVCRFSTMMARQNVWEYLKEIYPGLKKVVALCNMKTPYVLVYFYCMCIKNIAEREVFHNVYNLRRFIHYQEPGNIINMLQLRNKGIKSVFVYASSTTTSADNNGLNKQLYKYYSHLFFDYMLSNTTAISYFKSNANFIREYIDCGNFHADNVFAVRNNQELKATIKKKCGITEDKTLIGFFDTAIGVRGIINNASGQKLYEYMLRLINENEKYWFLVKTRNLKRFKSGSEVEKMYQKLIAHPQVVSINDVDQEYSPYEYMGLCDVLVGGHFSSVINEALSGGVPTICYLPNDIANRECFEIHKFSEIVFDSYEGLEKLVKYWAQSTDSQMQDIRDAYVCKYIDQYSDGTATNRLKQALQGQHSEQAKNININVC